MTWLRWVGVQGFHERKHEGSSWRQLSKGGMREDNMAVGVRLAWEGAGLTGGHAPPHLHGSCPNLGEGGSFAQWMLLAAKNSGILFLIIWLEVGEDRHREKNLEFYIRKMKNLNQREKAKQGKEAL